MQFDIVGKAVRVLKLPTVNYDNHTIKVVPAQVGDVNSRFFEVHLYDDRGEIPFSQYNELYLGVTLPDDSVEYSVGEIDGDIGYVKLLSSMLQEAGRLKCSVMLRGQDDNNEEVWLTSQTFYVTVLSSSVFDESQAGNDDDYNLLLGLIKDVEDLEENIETAEAARVEAEKKRVQAENGRVEAENQRVENENERIANENARKQAEQGRVNAENARVEAEKNRVTAENGRVSAENARVDAEEARESAETQREENEADRQSAESARAQAERERVTAENNRVSAENAREAAEDQREENEDERIANENARKDAESKRVTAEQGRVSAETGRVNAEQNRVTAETAREQAEDERELSESQREDAEADRKEAEADRVSAETGRVNAENGRVTAEQGRVTAESGRVEAESDRVTEFNQMKQELEEVTQAAQQVVDEAEEQGITGTVKFDRAQSLTDEQKQQARANIDAAGTDGTYPTLGAGYLANSKYVIVETTSVGWWKIADLTIDHLMQIHNVNSTSYSGVILIQGVTRSGDGFDYANTGLIEIDATTANGVFATTNMRNIIKIISGDIEPNNLAVVNNSDTLSIYANYPVYARYCWTVICEAYGLHTGKAIEITPTFYGTTAPEGAVYAVVRNRASADADGNDISTTYAKLASPTFTGTPNAPTPSTTDDSTRIATTAYVRDVIPTIKVNNATQADKVGSADVGSGVLPVWIDNGTPKAISIKNLTAKDDIGYDVTGDRLKLVTVSAITYWNGAYQGTISNLSRAATPATNSDTNEIATTAWVRDVVPGIKVNSASASDTATKLATGRTIRVNLASTSTATFDGSTNITPGVTGVLPVANGGTGASSLANITVGAATKASQDSYGNSLMFYKEDTNLLKNGTESYDFNDYEEYGHYELHGTSDHSLVNFPISSRNPTATNCNWYLDVYRRTSTYITQLAYSVRTDGAVAIRVKDNGTWGAWRLLFDQGVAQSIPAASETVLGGARIWTDSDGYLCLDTQ